MDKKEIKAIVDSKQSKSKKMVALYLGGLEIKEIATELQVRYNFVYNVVSNYCRINDVELRTVKRASKKDAIIALIEEGKTNNEISAALKVSYNYVFNVRKDFERKVAEAK